jgi:hypothetical protein
MSCSTTAKDISASKSFENRCDQRPNKKADSFMKKLPVRVALQLVANLSIVFEPFLPFSREKECLTL